MNRIAWKNLRDPSGVVHAAKSSWTTKCGRRFIEAGYPVKGVIPTWDAVTCSQCRVIQQEVAA